MAKVNYDIALTHIITRKKQTIVAALGVTIGVAMYLFMNSMDSGFTRFSRDQIFNNNPHLKVFKDDEVSTVLTASTDEYMKVLVNPQITTLSKTLVNPNQLLAQVKKQEYITDAIAQVDLTLFYNRGKTQIKGNGRGVNMLEYGAMFNTEDYMVAGELRSLTDNLNGIIIGNGIAEKLNLNIGDDLNVSSSFGVSKVLKVVGIFSTGNSKTDEAQSYVNTSTAQQLMKESSSFLTTIYANTSDPDKSEIYSSKLSQQVPYSVEDWKTTNSDAVAQDKTRASMMTAISLVILCVAAFGIYNILSATISQKINDIAILKAIGFNGKDVVRIFVSEALIMGFLGTIVGLIFGASLIAIMSKVYVGGAIGFFPIGFELDLFLISSAMGIFITFCAGYFPARKAAQVDPVEIFRT